MNDRSCGHTSLATHVARGLAIAALVLYAMSPTVALADQPCGTKLYPFPFTDVGSVADPFCPGIMEAYTTGITKGSSPTTFSPGDTVPRLQMTTFLQRSLDTGLARTSRRGALNQWWTAKNRQAMLDIDVGGSAAVRCAADGASIWVSNAGQVVRVEASTGKILGTWTGVPASVPLMSIAGGIVVAGQGLPNGSLYYLDTTSAPGAAFLLANNLGGNPAGIAFDGDKVWTANRSGSVSIVTPQDTPPLPVTTVSTGFQNLGGILYDGAHIWVTDMNANKLLKLDANGNILQTVPVGTAPNFLTFDGTNLWVPNSGDNSISVVQASNGNVVATIAGDATNKLAGPVSASFDGERVLVANYTGASVSLFKAADLSFIANVPLGAGAVPLGTCSDGISFWITDQNAKRLLRL
jgi:hypothetical protein